MVTFFRVLDSDRHVFFCPMNFAADTYKGCPHGCCYCYAPSYAARFKKYSESFQLFRRFRPRLDNRNDLTKIERAVETSNVKGTCDEKQEVLVKKAIEHKQPLRVGSVSEPFGSPLESDRGDTYNILEMLIAHDYPFVVCTKSPLVATPKYINLLKSTKKVGVQISLISSNEGLIRCLEVSKDGASPSAAARLEALRRLSEEGIFTTCRIQPIIPQVTEYGIRDLIYALAQAGVSHVIAEFLWFPTGHAEDMSARLKQAIDLYSGSGGFVGNDLKKYKNDLYAFYKSFDDHSTGYGRVFFSRIMMGQIMPRIAAVVIEANKEFKTNMTFGSGNEETTYLNSTNNCCGVDRLEGFASGTPCTAHTVLKISKKKGRAKFSDFEALYNPCMDKFSNLWTKREKNGYFLENRVFKLRSATSGTQVEYVYDEKAIPEPSR
jgi:DNA repair photolyase